jgi:hypothetical protein
MDEKTMVAKELVKVASLLVAEEGEAPEAEDEAFVQKLRDIRTGLLSINKKKNTRLSDYGIGVIRPTTKVHELVDVLLKVVATK